MAAHRLGDSAAANADFAAAIEEVLDVYRRSYDPARPVVCMDETPRQLIGRSRQPVPAEPGRPEREGYEYHRLGTCNVFMATEPLAGRRTTETDWAHFLDDIARRYADAERIALVMDNLNTHVPALYKTLSRPPEPRRFETGSTSSTRPSTVAGCSGSRR